MLEGESPGVAELITIVCQRVIYIPNSLNLIQVTLQLTHCGQVTQICVFNTVKLGTSASSP